MDYANGQGPRQAGGCVTSDRAFDARPFFNKTEAFDDCQTTAHNLLVNYFDLFDGIL